MLQIKDATYVHLNQYINMVVSIYETSVHIVLHNHAHELVIVVCIPRKAWFILLVYDIFAFSMRFKSFNCVFVLLLQEIL
jgi:hypothetical protein